MQEEKIKDGFYKIRPAGRHIITIGKGLIKDKYGAIVELVKNAYDADSPSCKISLLPYKRELDGVTNKGIKIVIKDEGHGMNFSTVTDTWMVPSTKDKILRKGESPKGRYLQGKKGIGRYSASMIGDDLLLETINEEGERTTLYLIWEDFERAQYLEDVDVLIESFKTKQKKGTEIIIIGDEEHLHSWDRKQLRNLKSELRKLIPPFDDEIFPKNKNNEEFNISLELGDFGYEGYSNYIEDIEPYPLFDFYDYRIYGNISEEGIAKLSFHNNRIINSNDIKIPDFQIALNTDDKEEKEKYPGGITLDFRVFDRDASSIDGLIERGLKDPTSGESIGKREARRILTMFSGIGVYRNGFRIRPIGDPGYDWLSLDNSRVQNPSLRVGCDQVIGFIHIKDEKKSGLYEKSARDGLKETPEYFGLISIAQEVLRELETRRFGYRRKKGLGRSKGNISKKIEKLYSLQDVQIKIDRELKSIGISIENRDKVAKIIERKEIDNNKIADELKETIALYQGQATIGKIVDLILHEGRKPLGYFKNQIPLINEWAESLNNEFDSELLKKTTNRVTKIGEQGGILTNLFKKIDPLSSKKRGKPRKIKLDKILKDVKGVFQSEIEKQNIVYDINIESKDLISGWEIDFYVTFTNLVENSIYWLKRSKKDIKKISIKSFVFEGNIIIEYRDNGPGISKDFIENGDIFDPEFSTKKETSTGLGLSIAGEAMKRSGAELKAIYSNDGAFFKIEINENNENFDN